MAKDLGGNKIKGIKSLTGLECGLDQTTCRPLNLKEEEMFGINKSDDPQVKLKVKVEEEICNCPLMSQTCIQEQCAWWNKDEKGCAVLVLSDKEFV